MNAEPKFRCADCKRGVLNRSVPRCLYCGADLPAEARLAPEIVAQRDVDLARAEAARARRAGVAPDGAGSGALDAVDGAVTAVEVVDTFVDGISAIGDLFS